MVNLIHREHSRKIVMPGKPLDKVRYVGSPDQNIWDYLRLFVDGKSWVWEFAVGKARDHLIFGADNEQ